MHYGQSCLLMVNTDLNFSDKSIIHFALPPEKLNSEVPLYNLKLHCFKVLACRRRPDLISPVPKFYVPSMACRRHALADHLAGSVVSCIRWLFAFTEIKDPTPGVGFLLRLVICPSAKYNQRAYNLWYNQQEAGKAGLLTRWSLLEATQVHDLHFACVSAAITGRGF